MSGTPAGPGDVTTRLGRLERQNRRLRICLVAVGLAVVGALFFDVRPAITQPASATFDTLKAHAFVVTDQNGKPRAVLDLLPGGRPRLLFMDAAGKPRAMLDLQPNGQPSLALSDAAGKPRMDLSVGNDGQPSVILADAAGKPLVDLSVGNDGQPSLALENAAGKGRADLVMPVGGPRLFFSDAAGKLRAALVVGRGDQPALRLYDSAGKARLEVGSTFLTYPKQGGGARTPESSITAFDKTGTVIGRWPTP